MEKTIYDWNEVLDNQENPYNFSTIDNYKDYLSILIRHSIPGKWLDVGCGIGHFVECCNKYGIDCIGIEGHESAKEVAIKRFPQIKIDVKDITQGLPYDDNSFSVIFCNQVIEHIADKQTQKLIDEIYRVLKNEGIALINMPSIFNKEGVKEPSHINCMSVTSLNKYLKNSGFAEIYPIVYPKYIFGRNFISKAIIGILFFLFPFDFLTSNTAAIAKKKTNSKLKIHSKRKYYIDKMMKW